MRRIRCPGSGNDRQGSRGRHNTYGFNRARAHQTHQKRKQLEIPLSVLEWRHNRPDWYHVEASAPLGVRSPYDACMWAIVFPGVILTRSQAIGLSDSSPQRDGFVFEFCRHCSVWRDFMVSVEEAVAVVFWLFGCCSQHLLYRSQFHLKICFSGFYFRRFHPFEHVETANLISTQRKSHPRISWFTLRVFDWREPRHNHGSAFVNEVWRLLEFPSWALIMMESPPDVGLNVELPGYARV